MNNKSNTCIACVYNSPKNSTYTKEHECNVLQLTEEQLAKFSESDQIVIRGDFKRRIGTKENKRGSSRTSYLPGISGL